MSTTTITETMIYSTKPLYNITNKTYTQLFNRKAMGQIWEKRKDFDVGQVELIDCLYKSVKKRTTDSCESLIEYRLSSSNAGKLGYGRYYGQKGSLEQLEKDVRGTLCNKYYVDVDVVNCHPTIIPQMAKMWFNLDMPNMMKYVINRAYFFQLMKDKANFTEDMTKSLILRILYGGCIKDKYTLSDDSDMEMPSEFLEIKNEMRKFTSLLMKEDCHKDLLEGLQRLRKHNTPGSFTAHIVQTEERKLLESMVNWFTENNHRVDVLAYDGCQVRLDEKNSVAYDELLGDVSEAIKKDTGYTILLKLKSFETISFDTEDDEKDDTEYQNMKEEWEQDHFYFKPTNTICEVSQEGIQHFNMEHASEAFNMWLLTSKKDKKEKRHFIKEWRTDVNRRVVDKFVYKMPEECSRNECSLFAGFGYKNITATITDEQRKDAIATFKDILSAICNDEAKVIEFVLKAMAHMIKKPFEKTGIIIAFASFYQGSGKDTIMLILKKVIGDFHTAHYTSTEAYWEKHDTNMEGAVFVYLEEACSALNKAKVNELKARITSDTLMINPKGIKGYTIPNIARNWMTTNEAEPFKIEEQDRRGLLIAPNNRCVKYNWVDIYKKILTPEYIKAVGEYLETVDINNWNPRDFPETAIKKEMKIQSKTSEDNFFEQWIRDDDEWITGSEIFNSYRDYCNENSLPHCQNVLSFARKLVPFQNKKFQFKRGPKNVGYYKPLEVIEA